MTNHLSKQKRSNSIITFAIIWLILFVLYFPARNAGFVGDLPGWQSQLSDLSFWDYMNRTRSNIQGMFQLTQFNTNLLHGLFGTNAVAWSVLYITLQASNSFLLFILCRRLFEDTGVKHAATVAFTGAIFFSVCPYISEVVVWKAAFHYLQGLLLMLLVLLFVQKFQKQPLTKYAWAAGIIFLLSTFSLEFFYLTPWMGLIMALYYRFALAGDKRIFSKTIWLFFIPQILLFISHFFFLHMLYGNATQFGAGPVLPITIYLSKTAKYVFHIIFLGRFFPLPIRERIYHYSESIAGIIITYSALAVIGIYLITQFRKMHANIKAASLLIIWTGLILLLIMPRWFPNMLLVQYDRYTYFLDAFLMMLAALIIFVIPNKIVKAMLVFSYLLVNIYFTHKVMQYWKESAQVVNKLLSTLPPAGNKTIILLSLPESLNGVQMIGTKQESEFKHLYDLLQQHTLNNKIYDAVSFNMASIHDGVHVNVINDSSLRVTLNQWGTWWWYEGLGGHSYENDDYKLNMVDQGHLYEMTLKKNADSFLLLYQQGDAWKIVNWRLKHADQY